MKILDTCHTFYKIHSNLVFERPFFYSRFGDGDIAVMDGMDDKFHKANEQLAQEVKRAFLINDPHYLKALSGNYPIEEKMQRGLFYPFDNKHYLEEIALDINPDLREYYNPIALHYFYCFEPYLFDRMMTKYIKPKKKLVISCFNQAIVEKMMGPIDYFVSVPERDAYTTIEQWYPLILQNKDDVDAIFPFAGIATRAVQKRLWADGFRGYCIDFGSIIDSYAGVQTRRWIKKIGGHENRYNL